MVVHHEHARAPGLLVGRLRARRELRVVLRNRCDGDLDHEFAAPTRSLAMGLHATPLHLDEPVNDRQADAKSALGPVEGAIGLREKVKNSG